MRKSFLAANPDLVAFDMTRNGDDVTLSLGLRKGPSRADFRLFGTKHDYYRLSMGTRLDETLKVLVKADPNLEAAGVERQDNVLVLKLQFAWPAGSAPPEPRPVPVAQAAPPPAAAPSPPPKPKPAPPPALEEPQRFTVPARPHQPPGTEAEVSIGSVPQASPPVAAKPPKETPAPPRAPEAPKQPLETPAAGAYRAAVAAGTPEALDRFATAHPSSPEAEEARRRAQGLREEVAYQAAIAKHEATAYQEFIEAFPASGRRAEIEARHRVLEEERRRTEVDRRAREVDEGRRRDAYNQARKLDSAEAYRVFLAAYPDGPEAKEAKNRATAIEADDDAFEAARSSPEALDAYVATFPKGRHEAKAKKLAQEIRTARMDSEYQTAVARGTRADWETFLAAWPRSPKAAQARAALEALTKAAAPEPSRSTEATPVPGRATLVAPRVVQLPALDAKTDDPAWRGAQALDVALSGDGGARSIRVKALHDGATVMLLAEWTDPSRDTMYRPWMWDPARKTYQQNEQIDDALAVALYRGRGPSDACMLTGEEHDADVWRWRAHWSEISGLADDTRIRISRNRIPQSNPYLAASGGGQVWIREDADEGTAGWTFFIPVEFQGPVVPSYRPTPARGSRKDVKARGSWSPAGSSSGTWSVTFSRALDTKQPDDVALVEGRGHPVSLAVYDKNEKGRHAASQVVSLELRGR